MLKESPRGSWLLICAYDEVPDLEKLQRKHAAEQKKKKKAKRTPFVLPLDLVADNAGYIIWKDSKLVLFYTNDLESTPSVSILDGKSNEAISCVRGLAPLKRWTGIETMH